MRESPKVQHVTKQGENIPDWQVRKPMRGEEALQEQYKDLFSPDEIAACFQAAKRDVAASLKMPDGLQLEAKAVPIARAKLERMKKLNGHSE